MTIKVNINPLDSVSTFNYLGVTIVFNNINWEYLYQNMRKEKRCWLMVSGVLAKIRATVRTIAIFYKAVVQDVLLYGSE